MNITPKLSAVALGLAVTVTSFAEEAYDFDAAHTQFTFSIRHLGLVNVRGQFREFTGSVTMDGDTVTGARAVIKAASVDTANQNRDDHLRNPDFFEVETYSDITFESTAVERTDEGLVLKGRLTIKQTTKEVEIPMTQAGPIDDPWGNQRVGLTGELVVNRRDYGVNHDGPSDRAIGQDVTITIEIQAVRAQPAEGDE